MISKKLPIGWTLDEVCDSLNVMTKAKLTNRLVPYCTQFFLLETNWLSKHSERVKLATKEVKAVLASKKTHKISLLKLCSLPFLHPDCFQRFLPYLPNDSVKVLDYVALNGNIDQFEVEEKFGIKGFTEGKHLDRYRNPIELPSPELCFYDCEEVNKYSFYHSSEDKIIYSLELQVRNLILHLLYPEPIEVGSYEPDPEKGESVFEGEHHILQELPGLLIRIQQKPPRLSKKGKTSIATIRSLGKKLKLEEFYPDAKADELRYIRAKSLVGLTSLVEKLTPTDLPRFIKNAFNLEFTSYFHLPIHLLDYIGGMTRVKEYYLTDYEEHFKQFLMPLEVGKWYAFEKIELSLRRQLFLSSPIEMHGIYDLDVSVPDDRFFDGKKTITIKQDNFEQMIVWPSFRAMLFMMASWGILDLVFTKPDISYLSRTADSPYDGIKAFRLTELGSFVINQTDHYHSKVKAPFTLELAKDSLSILLADGSHERAATAIASFAKPFGSKRFYTDANLFLNDCKDSTDLQGKIDLFSSLFSTELPAVWKDFFHEISQKVNPLEEEDEFSVFRINPENRNLLQLIVRDPELKKLSLKAEGYLILIPEKNVNKYRKRLQHFGYLLE